MDKPALQKWEQIADGLWRIPVPGGWIYSSQGESAPVCFVPHPPPEVFCTGYIPAPPATVPAVAWPPGTVLGSEAH